MKKYRVTLFVLILMMGVLSIPVSAATKDEQVVRIGYYPVSEYQDKDENGEYWGFGYDYYIQIQKYTGWTYKFVEASYAECMQMLSAGKLDVVSGVIPTDARRERMNFSNYSISNTQNKLYAKIDDTDMFYESYEQFNGATVGIMRGTLKEGLTSYAKAHDFTIEVREYNSSAEMEEALLNGEVQLMYATSIAATAQTKIVARFEKTALYYAVSKSADEIGEELDLALQKIIDNNPNFYTEMSEKYMVSGANAIATFTKEEYEYIHSNQPVYVIMNDDWAPICWYDEESQSYQGIINDTLEQLSEYSGLKFICCNETDFNKMAGDNPEIVNNVLAILADDTAWASKQNVMMTNRILDASMVMVTKRGVSQSNSQQTLLYALPERYYVSWKTEKVIPEANITYYPTIEACVNAVNEGKADATYMNEIVASYYLSMLQYSDLFATVSLELNENLAFAINRDTNKPLLGIMDKSIMCISKNDMTNIIMENSVAAQRVTLIGLFYSNPVLFVSIVVFVMLAVGIAVVTTILLVVKRRRLAARLAMEQESAAARTEFFMMISHELRTPLNAIVGYLDMAVKLCQKNSLEREYLKRSQNAARQLTSVAQDMLDYTEISSKKATLHPKMFDLKDVVYHIGENSSLLADKKNISFKIRVQNIEHEFVMGDELRVSQIMQNLLSNSIKFTADGGQVEAEVKEKILEDGHIEICFVAKDTGKGMSEEFLEKVCAPFNQSDPSYSRTHGGLGLGLYITKYYLDAMGGRMEVESKLGQGSIFTIYIPLEKAKSEQVLSQDIDYSHVRALICGANKEENKELKNLLKRLKIKCDLVSATEMALRRIKSRMSTNYAYSLCVIDEECIMENQTFLSEVYAMDEKFMIFIMSNGNKKMDIPEEYNLKCKVLSKPIFQSVLFDAVITNFGAYEPEDNEMLPNFEGIVALIAEDNEINADILVRILGKMNIKTKVCANGKLALEAFEQESREKFDVIFMDIQMPVMDGYEATRRIRQTQAGREIPIIAVSANAFPSDIDNSMRAGMNEHLSKPVDAKQLGKTIAHYVTSGSDSKN